MKTILITIVVSISLAGCTEKYNPVVNHQSDVIVVQGLVTNLKEAYQVSISVATPYDSGLNYRPVTAKSVIIKDNLGNVYPLQWNLQFYYSDSSEFTAVPGRSYILHIEMSNGDIYESTPQQLPATASEDSIYVTNANEDYYYENPLGQITTLFENGAATYMDISYSSDSIAQFRFGNTLLICWENYYLYTETMKNGGVPFNSAGKFICPLCPYIVYNWKDFTPIPQITLSLPTNRIGSKEFKHSLACFFPFDRTLYDINDHDTCGYPLIGEGGLMADTCLPITCFNRIAWVLETRLYALNTVSSVYYQEINAQITSTGKLFDPIAVQLQGNMKCINNPGKMVFGLFEVSSCIKGTYLLHQNSDGSMIYQPITNIVSQIPGTGTVQTKPAFWQIIFNNSISNVITCITQN